MAEPTREMREWRAELEARLKAKQVELLELQAEETSMTRQIRLIDELLSGGEAASDFRHVLLELLTEEARPLRLTELRGLLEKRGVQIPGKGTDANLIVHLRRMPGVQRVDRGTYALDGTAVTKPVAPKRKKRRRRKKATTIRAKAVTRSERRSD
jgi:hypothetical protein